MELARHLAKLEKHWPAVAIEGLASSSPPTLEVGQELKVTARLRLGGLEPDDLQVSPLYHGALSGSPDLDQGEDAIASGESTPMELIDRDAEGVTYRAQARPSTELTRSRRSPPLVTRWWPGCRPLLPASTPVHNRLP